MIKLDDQPPSDNPGKRPLGWNRYLFTPDLWEIIQLLHKSPISVVVTGETALAGYWLHNRQVERIELCSPAPHELAEFISKYVTTLQNAVSYPGFFRLYTPTMTVDIEEIPPGTSPLPPSCTGCLPCLSLFDLAVNRWLHMLDKSSTTLLFDLYFLHKAGIDLIEAARHTSKVDIGCTPRALALSLYKLCTEHTLTPPSTALRPVTEKSLKSLALRLRDKLALETFY